MKSKKKISSWLLFLAGIGFVGWGASLPNQMYSNLLLAFGGAISGAGISQIVALFSGINFLSSISNTINSNFRSKEDKIDGNREKFYHYHITQMNGSCVWRHSIIDFSNSTDVNALNTRVRYKGKDDSYSYYKIEAGLRDERLIMFIKSENRDEPTIIEIYPTLGKDIQINHCGILVVESWDEKDIISRCILSKSPINNWKKLGTVNDETAVKLDTIWINGINHSFKPLTDGISKRLTEKQAVVS